MRSRQLGFASLSRPLRDALEKWEQLAEDAQRLGATETLYDALWRLACAHAALRDVDRALRLADVCDDLAARSLPKELGKSRSNTGDALSHSRNFYEAERLLRSAFRTFQERDQQRRARYCAAVIARVLLESGRWDEARRTAADLGKPEQEKAGATRGIALAVLGRLDVHQGLETASGRLTTAWLDVRHTRDLSYPWPVAAACAEAAWIRGEDGAAAEPIRQALHRARAMGHPWAVGELTWWARRAGLDPPAPEVALPELWAAALAGDWAAAADTWANLGRPLDEAMALTEVDLAARRRALDLFVELGASADADRLRQQLRAAGETNLPFTTVTVR